MEPAGRQLKFLTHVLHFPLQEPVLFSCSIAENIAYGAAGLSSVTAQQVERAAEVANAAEFIRSFPQGFDTVVGEKGILLSGTVAHTFLSFWPTPVSVAALAPGSSTWFPVLCHLLMRFSSLWLRKFTSSFLKGCVSFTFYPEPSSGMLLSCAQ